MTQYTEGELRAAVEEAASRRTYVMAHAYIPESIVRAAAPESARSSTATSSTPSRRG